MRVTIRGQRKEFDRSQCRSGLSAAIFSAAIFNAAIFNAAIIADVAFAALRRLLHWQYAGSEMQYYYLYVTNAK